MKTTWKRRKIMRPHLETIEGVNGLPIVRPTEPKLSTLYDGPTTEIVNIKDFFWHAELLVLCFLAENSDASLKFGGMDIGA